MTSRNCLTCNTPFPPAQGKRYCRPECRKSSLAYVSQCKSLGIEKSVICVGCGSEFTHDGSHGRKWCSVECRTRTITVRRWAEMLCLECDAEFQPRNRHQVTCSAKCKKAYRQSTAQPMPRKPRTAIPEKAHDKESRSCKQCGDSFEVFTYERHKFCNKRCAQTYHNKTQGMAKTMRLLGDAFSIKACEICGYDRRVDSAHILPAREGWPLAPWNVFKLCPNHHTAFDSGKLMQDELNKLGVGFLAA